MDYFGIQAATGFVRYLGSSTPRFPTEGHGYQNRQSRSQEITPVLPAMGIHYLET